MTRHGNPYWPRSLSFRPTPTPVQQAPVVLAKSNTASTRGSPQRQPTIQQGGERSVPEHSIPFGAKLAGPGKQIAGRAQIKEDIIPNFHTDPTTRRLAVEIGRFIIISPKKKEPFVILLTGPTDRKIMAKDPKVEKFDLASFSFKQKTSDQHGKEVYELSFNFDGNKCKITGFSWDESNKLYSEAMDSRSTGF